MKSITLRILRHGETYLNRYGKMQGWADSPLTAKGEEDARLAGRKLALEEFAAVYTSDLGRTIATARIICNESRVNKKPPILARKEWRESSFGAFDGSFQAYAYSRVARNLGLDLASWDEIYRVVPFEDMGSAIKAVDPAHMAESNEEVRERLRRGLEEVLDGARDGDRIMVVTHGNAIRILVNMLDDSVDVGVALKNAGITTVRFMGDAVSIVGFNE